MLIELNDEINRFEDDDTASEEWVFDLLAISDILSWLYADMYLMQSIHIIFFTGMTSNSIQNKRQMNGGIEESEEKAIDWRIQILKAGTLKCYRS